MAISKSERLARVHNVAMQRANHSMGPQLIVRLQCLRDRRFANIPGSQWESLQEQFANTPRFEHNKTRAAIDRIFGEYRNNRISVDFRAKGSEADAETANLLNGLYRADEQRSNAQEAYDNAFDEAATGGFGAWRIRAKYEDESDADDDYQQICIEPIYDADASVFFDIDAKRQDKWDATHCFVLYSMSPEAAIEEYGEPVASFSHFIKMNEFDWFTPNVVYVAEYYEVEEKSRWLTVFKQQLSNEEIKKYDDELEDGEEQNLLDSGFVAARRKKVKQRKIHKYIIDGARVLEDQGYIAGEYIPIVPTYGKRVFIDNMERPFGIVRFMVDPQRLYNMVLTYFAEIAAKSPVQLPIFHPEQIQGHENVWANQDIDRPAYLTLNPDVDGSGNSMPLQPPPMSPLPQVPQALVTLIQLCGNDIMDLSGGQQAADQVQSNISAQAISLVQNRQDMQSFIYMDNMAKAMKCSGTIWRSMARELYVDDDRDMRVVNPDDSDSVVTLMQKQMDDSGVYQIGNDITKGDYETVVDVGPSFATKRDSTVKALMGIMQLTQDPQEQAILSSLIIQNIDGEGLDDLKDYNRKKLVSIGVLKPNEEEQKQMEQAAQNKQPTPNDLWALSEARKNDAVSVRENSTTVKNIADAEKTQAETAVMLQQANGDQLQQILQILQAMQQSSGVNITPQVGTSNLGQSDNAPDGSSVAQIPVMPPQTT